MKCPWFNNTDFVDDITDISFILPEYYPKWNLDVIRQNNLYIKNEYLTGKKENKDINRGPLFKFLTCGSLQNTTCYKNEYLTGPRENKNMWHTDTDYILKWYTNNNEYLTGKKENKDMNHKIKNANNDSVKNMLDKWTSERRTKIMIPKMIKHNGPATIVFWADGTKTVVKANPDLIEEKRICYLDESGKRHYKTVTIDRTDDSAAVMYAFVKRWICHNEDKKFHRLLKVVESRDEK